MIVKGTQEGTTEEIELVKKLNIDKNSSLWKVLNLLENKNYYAVKCTNKVLSKVSNKKVLPKTDVFIITSFDEIIIKDGYLDEDLIEEQNIQYKIIINSGISVKEKNSKSYTYQKMTIETFYKIFGNYELGCAIAYFTTQKDFDKNLILEKSWHTSKDKVIDKLRQISNDYNYPTSLVLDSYQNIKRSAVKLTKHIINNNSNISNFIFKGIGAFDDPYYAMFIYKEECMYENNIPEKYSITTGSGRSKGNYTIVIKP